MIYKCKICNGTGRILSGILDFFSQQGRVCPACNGAGEFEINLPPERLTTCKYCKGRGLTLPTFVTAFGDRQICPACKGLGLIVRPAIGKAKKTSNEVSVPQMPRLSRYHYDIAVSFAGEDREVVQEYCNCLISKGLTVFYDKYEEAELWGANLYDKFDDVYRKKALFCVIFISKHYARKLWTNHERKFAQARAFQENREYILPVRLDDTEIPGILPTIGYVDFKKNSIGKLVEMTINKVKPLKKNK